MRRPDGSWFKQPPDYPPIKTDSEYTYEMCILVDYIKSEQWIIIYTYLDSKEG